MDHRSRHLPPPPPRPNIHFPLVTPPHAPPLRPPPPPGPPPSHAFRPPPPFQPPPPRPHHQPYQFRPNHDDRRRHEYPVPELSFTHRGYCEEPLRGLQRPPSRRPVVFDDRVPQRVYVNRPVNEFDQNSERLVRRQVDGFDRESPRVVHNRQSEFDRELQRVHPGRPTKEFDREPQRLLLSGPTEFEQEQQRIHLHRQIEYNQDHQRQSHHRCLEFGQEQHQRLQHQVSGRFEQEWERLQHSRPLEFDQERQRIQVKLDQDQRHLHRQQQIDLKSMSPGFPVDRFSGHGSAEGTFRTRFDFGSNGDGVNLRGEIALACRDEFPRLSHVGFDSGLGLNHGSVSNRELGTDMVSYDRESVRNCGGDGMRDIQRFDHSRVETGDNEIEREDGHYSSDLGRYDTRGSREVGREIKHTPKKQLQKKSAFLRIQMAKPTYRNRDDDRLRYTGNSNNTNVRSPYKGKGHVVEKRSGSPLDLDVSFKSNALIAKAMSSAPSDACLTPRHTKIRKVIDISRDSSNIQSKLEGFTQSAKNSVETLKDCGVRNMRGCSLQPGSCNTNVPSLKSVVVLPSRDKDDNNIGSRSSSTVKRKIKMVKKVISLPCSSSLQLIKKQAESVVFDSCAQKLDKASGSNKCTNPTKEENSFSGTGLLEDVNLQACIIEQSLLPDMNKMDESSQAARLADSSMDAISGMESGHNFEHVKNSSDVSSTSLEGNEMEVPKTSVISEISSCGLTATSNFDVDPVNLSCVNMKPATNVLECATKQFIDKEDASAHENTMGVHSKTPLSIEGNTECGSSSSEIVNKNSCSEYNKLISDLGFEDGSVNSTEKNVVSDADGKADDNTCIDRFRTLINAKTGVGISKYVTSTPISVTLSSRVEAGNQHCVSFADNCDFRSSIIDLGNTCIYSGGNPIPIGLSSNHSDQQPVTTPCGILLEGTNDDSVPTDNSSRNQFDNSRTEDVCFGSSNLANPSLEIDTTLSILDKSLGYSKALATGHENISVDQHPLRDRLSIFHMNNSAELSGDKVRTKLTEPDGCSIGHEIILKDLASGLGSLIANANETREGLRMVDGTVSTTEFPFDDEIGIAHPEEGVAPTSTDAPEGAKFLHGDNQIGGSLEAVAAVRRESCDDYDDNLKLNLPCVNSYSSGVNSVNSDKDDASLCILATHQDNEMDMENDASKLILPAPHEGIVAHDGIAENQELRDKSYAFDLGCESCVYMKNDYPSECNTSLFVNAGMAPKTDLNDKVVLALDKTLDSGSPETLPHVTPMQLFDDKELSLHGEICGGSIQEDENEANEKQVIDCERIFSLCTSSPQYPSNMTPDHPVENKEVPSQKTVSFFPSDSENLDRVSAEEFQVKTKPSQSFPKAPPGLSVTSSTHTGKARTWRRDESAMSSLSRNKPLTIFPLQKKSLPDFGKMHTSYIRKGNSLVRKELRLGTLPQNSSLHRMNSSFSQDLKKITTSDNKAPNCTVDVDSPDTTRRGAVNAPSERPKTSPLLSDMTAASPVVPIISECTPRTVEDASGSCKSTSDRSVSTKTNIVSGTCENVLKTSEVSEDQINSVCILGSQNKVNVKDSMLNNGSVIYVKRKSNQLVAASSDLSVQGVEKSQASFPDSYYKKSKNQLIRTSYENLNNLNVDAQNSKVATERYCRKNHLHKVITKRTKMSKIPSVWSLCGTRSSKSGGVSLHRSSVFPNLFPWKRATYWRSFMQNSASLSNTSFSTRKMLLSRKMDLIYTRSVYGYSIRKSKVLSIGGSNLKWSKSMETQSKISDQEATLVAAASGKKTKEKNRAVRLSSGTKNRSRFSRERIFRIGSFRYKMDPSKRTLQRIPEEESSEPCRPSEKNAKQSYVPRRLVIGSDEYVRIGNGNQLVRDPKRRLRLLASEKVRWSLHTVRLRLAKKRKYCQFFTRFGKCNKDDGKCPYIHDPSKVAVCTKFLNDLCSNPNCKLTHKVIPERMPDCSYFLQGICANKDCPYRHVSVDPDAPTCEGFLRGYCADGDECRKKHSYVCPTFEVMGSCPNGSKCKLHHPKNRTSGKKRKRSGEQGISSGRYFGPMDHKISEDGMYMMERSLEQNDGDVFYKGSLPDYISLDVSSDDETEKDFKRRKRQLMYFEEDSLDMQAGDLEIIPAIIRGKIPTAFSLPSWGKIPTPLYPGSCKE